MYRSYINISWKKDQSIIKNIGKFPFTIKPVAPPQAPQKALRLPFTVLHHSLLALWQLSEWHFMDYMEKMSQTRKMTYFRCFALHDFMFSEAKMKKLLISIKDSIEYTQRSDEFDQIHKKWWRNQWFLFIWWTSSCDEWKYRRKCGRQASLLK